MRREKPKAHRVTSVARDLQSKAIQLYAETGNARHVGRELGIHNEQIRRILQSPEGSLTLERQLRENAKHRLIRMSALIDRTLEQLETTLNEGNEVINMKTGEIIRLKAGARDLIYALAWLHNSQDRWAELLSANQSVIEVQITPDEARRNLEKMKELVSSEERRLAVDVTQQPEQPQNPEPTQEPAENADWLS